MAALPSSFLSSSPSLTFISLSSGVLPVNEEERLEERGEGDGWSSRARGLISVAILTGAQAQGEERE
uniref:Uncharacterized protein n=1 Tax=Oryza glumipatula TaxID=40148 RepID=A0A0D9Y9C4_9ORYZ